MDKQTNTSGVTETCTFLELIRVQPTPSIVITAVSTSVLNALTALVATVGNSLMLFLMVRYRKLRTPPNVLVASLCVSDLLVGSLVQPLSCVRRCMDVFSKPNCAVRIIYAYGGFTSVVASLLGVSLVSLDRTIALVTPFRYVTLATTRRYTVTVIAMWSVVMGTTALPFLGVMNLRQFFFLLIGVVIISSSTVVVCYAVIYSVARAQLQKIAPQYQITTTQHCILDRTKTCAVIVGVLLLCYAPQIIVLLLRGVLGDNEVLVYIVDAWVDFLVFVNSSLNPIIYGCRLQEFRLAFLNLIGRDQRIRSATYLDEQGPSHYILQEILSAYNAAGNAQLI